MLQKLLISCKETLHSKLDIDPPDAHLCDDPILIQQVETIKYLNYLLGENLKDE